MCIYDHCESCPYIYVYFLHVIYCLIGYCLHMTVTFSQFWVLFVGCLCYFFLNNNTNIFLKYVLFLNEQISIISDHIKYFFLFPSTLVVQSARCQHCALICVPFKSNAQQLWRMRSVSVCERAATGQCHSVKTTVTAKAKDQKRHN